MRMQIFKVKKRLRKILKTITMFHLRCNTTVMCIPHLRFDCKVTTYYFVKFYFQESGHGVYILYIFFLSYAEDVTFIWTEARE